MMRRYPLTLIAGMAAMRRRASAANVPTETPCDIIRELTEVPAVEVDFEAPCGVGRLPEDLGLITITVTCRPDQVAKIAALIAEDEQ